MNAQEVHQLQLSQQAPPPLRNVKVDLSVVIPSTAYDAKDFIGRHVLALVLIAMMEVLLLLLVLVYLVVIMRTSNRP